MTVKFFETDSITKPATLAQHIAHLISVGEVKSLNPGTNRVITEDITRCCYVKCPTLIVFLGGMPWPWIGATYYHAHLGIPDKGRTIKGLVVCNSLDVSLIGPAYRSSPTLLSTLVT